MRNVKQAKDKVMRCRIKKKGSALRPQNPFGQNLFLIGFMGTGKTSIAQKLCSMYGMKMVEMDKTIAKRAGMNISEIFETFGEAHFREMETKLLLELKEQNNIVVSCGGGVPLREVNVKAMRGSGKIVLLTASPETVYQRVKNSHDRPILENNKNPSFIKGLMEQRREKYQAAADIAIATDGKSKQEICEELSEKLLGRI